MKSPDSIRLSEWQSAAEGVFSFLQSIEKVLKAMDLIMDTPRTRTRVAQCKTAMTMTKMLAREIWEARQGQLPLELSSVDDSIEVGTPEDGSWKMKEAP